MATVLTQPPPTHQEMPSMLLHIMSLVEGLCQRIEESPPTRERLKDFLGNYRTVSPSSSDGGKMANDLSCLIPTDLGALPNKSPTLEASSLDPQSRKLHIQASRSAGEGCPTLCPCTCHRLKRFTSFQFLKRWTGVLAVAYSEACKQSPVCSVTRCKRSSTALVHVSYVLPIWLASRMVSVLLKSRPLSGPKMELEPCRVIHTKSYFFAAVGKLEALRNLMARGQASALDVDPVDGYSALMVCSWIMRKIWSC
jgi:hypothetical protein